MSNAEREMNLFPERRQRKNNSHENEMRTNTSQYFEHSRSSEKQVTGEKDEIENGTSRSGRQTVLSFGSNGNLKAKMPLINPVSRSDAQRKGLKEVAEETLSLLPGLLATRPDVGKEGFLCKGSDVGALDPTFSPRLPATKIMVVDADTIDAALALSASSSASRSVCILNMANAELAGGGFKHGARAQEEALCYRSSLFFTLKPRYYPIPEAGAIYSPKVMVFRESQKDGHDLMDLRDPAALPVVSAVSVAAVCLPSLVTTTGGRKTYRSDKDRKLMMAKMRVILRTACRNRHRNIVLGAFGCGAFANPAEEVAVMWKVVLQEQEFQAGWFEHVLFAVMDIPGSNNFRIFRQALEGLKVG